MTGIKIINVKVVEVCSKCRNENDKIREYKDGRIVEDKDIACVGCSLKDGGRNRK